MQSFRTELHVEKADNLIGLYDGVLTLGSCFSDAIGTKLHDNKFTVCTNPFGTVYNPYSIHKLLRIALQNSHPADHTYHRHNDLFFHYDFHSSFSSPEKSTVDANIRQAIDQTHTVLKTAQWIILTYGTSVVYERTDTHEIVANCHKVSGNNFRKEILTEKKILESFEGFYRDLKTINPHCKIILTISPVRHIKDTLPVNSLSKAILRSACHTLTETHADTFYFPAYEIMLDDLRDYRFYKSDMLHPSAVAEEYIWQKFTESYFSDPAKAFLKIWQPVRNALHHKPFHAQSESHQQFLRTLLVQLQELKNTVSVEEEIASVQAQLHDAR